MAVCVCEREATSDMLPFPLPSTPLPRIVEEEGKKNVYILFLLSSKEGLLEKVNNIPVFVS